MPKMWARYFSNFQSYCPKVSNHPLSEKSPNLGPMLCFLKYFRQKIQRKNWRF
jgi:hypothetical protein